MGDVLVENHQKQAITFYKIKSVLVGKQIMKAMKTIIRTSLTASVIFATFCQSDSSAQIRLLNQEVEQSRDSCDTILQNVEARIKNNNYMTFEFKAQAIPNEWRQGARGRSVQLTVLLGKPWEGSEQRVKNVMASSQMLTEMSKQLIESCGNVAAVTYWQHQSGFKRTFGSIRGVIREFEYVGADRRNPNILRWGVDLSI